MMQAKIISSLEKCFWDECVNQKKSLRRFSLLKNERYSFQVCYDGPMEEVWPEFAFLEIESPLAEYITVSKVEQIPSEMPHHGRKYVDDDYLRTTSGLYPDLLRPVLPDERFHFSENLQCLWLELAPEGKAAAGEYSVKLIFRNVKDHEILAQAEVIAEIIGAELPEQKTLFSQWFYTDCIMQYYRTEAWSEKHWELIENFMVSAAKYGMNVILTPVFSPELDTYKGGYRPATQLVQITKCGNQYNFDFSRVGRWVDLCNKVGIRFFEISHFFSQWGAEACPQVWAMEENEEKRIFGWDTPALGEEYTNFLSQFIPAFLKYMKEEKQGADKRCWFHISDEPAEKHAEQYEKVSTFFRPLVAEYPVLDAMSHVEFYEKGLVSHPVAYIDKIQDFLEKEIPDLWMYYCGGPSLNITNKLFALPSYRNRIVGLQMYKYNIAGFLHWGFNFYNTRLSYRTVNPYRNSDGGMFVPSGDPYAVYPGDDGTAWSSLRQIVFFDALQDIRALQLCESLYGKEVVLAEMEKGIAPITFTDWPRSAEWLLDLRFRINNLIKAKIQ